MKAYAIAPLLLLLLTLTGCTLLGGGGSAPAEDRADSSGGESSELDGGSTACVMDRNWSLDIDDAAAKLSAFMLENGLTVVNSTGVGEQLIWFDEVGTAGSATDVTYTMTVDLGDGLTMTMTQHHAGSPYGQWGWDGDNDDTIVFDEWSDDYVVTTTTMIDGVSAPSTVNPMAGGLNGGSMTVSCSGDTLETQAEGSPFTQVWHAQ